MIKEEFKQNFYRHLPQYKEFLESYFSGKKVEYKDEVFQPGTEFQKQVWDVISSIPYGKTMTYKEIAEKIGRPKAIRAVGSACGKNNFPILIPCHRVLGTNGNLGGYSLGLEFKKQLLEFEKMNSM